MQRCPGRAYRRQGRRIRQLLSGCRGEPVKLLELLRRKPQAKSVVREHNLAHRTSDRPSAGTRGELPTSARTPHSVLHEADEAYKLSLGHPDAQRAPEEVDTSLPVAHYAAARVVGSQYRC
jgi:hypothetical protein